LKSKTAKHPSHKWLGYFRHRLPRRRLPQSSPAAAAFRYDPEKRGTTSESFRPGPAKSPVAAGSWRSHLRISETTSERLQNDQQISPVASGGLRNDQ
jgi:hypothetical protein